MSVTRERQAVGSRLGEKKVHWELLLYVGTENCLNKSLGARGTTGLQGGSWAGRRVVQHALHWVLGSHLYGVEGG